MPSKPTRIVTDLLPDAPLQQSARTLFDAIDRQYIDTQILGCQQHLADSLLNGVIATWVYVDPTSPALSVGDVICRAPTSTSIARVTLATPGALAIAGAPIGIILAAAAQGTRGRAAILGLLPPSITGLAASQGVARVSSAGRVERVVALSSGDYPIGRIDSTGYLTLGPGGAASVGGRIARVTQAIAFDDDDFASLSAGVKTFTKALGDTTDNRHLLGIMVQTGGSAVGFDDGAGGTYVLDVGWSLNPGALIDALDVSAASSGLAYNGNGTENVVGIELGALQLQMTLTSDNDLNTVIQGSVDVALTCYVP